MKRMLAVMVGTMMLFGAVGIAQAKESPTPNSMKIGYVDMNRSLNEVNEGKTAKAKLEADGKAKKQKLEKMQAELKTMKEDLDKQSLILSKEALKDKEAAFQQKFFELQKMSAQFEQEFSEREINFIKPISEKLQKVIQQIGKEEGYSMIVPREMALYSLPGTDLTDKVIAKYNSTK